MKAFMFNNTCDLPARAHVNGLVSNSAYQSNLFTNEYGIYSKERRHVVFPFSAKTNLKTPIEALEQAANKSHCFCETPTPFWRLGYYNPVSSIGIEALHNICHGVFFEILKQSRKNGDLSLAEETVINCYLKKMKLPKNLNKRINALDGMTAMQCLIVLLFGTGLFACLGEVSHHLIEDLGQITRVLFSPSIARTELPDLRTKAKNFVELANNYFGDVCMTHNMMQFAYVMEDFEKFGPAFTHAGCFAIFTIIHFIVHNLTS